MDFERIGEGIAFRRIVGNVVRQANDAAEEWEEALRVARARAEAHAAGRTGQIVALRDALREVAPDHPLLAPTGRVLSSGDPEVTWHAVYDDPYDVVARRHGIDLVERAMAPAEARRAAVISEPVECRRILMCRTWWFRGEQYRTEAGAVAARRRAAEAPYC
jgi:hypothetical protein